MANTVIKTTDMAKVQNIEFTSRFTDNITRLQIVLGLMAPIAKQPGTVLKIYKTTGTLDTTDAAEGEVLALSEYKRTAVAVNEMTLHKRAKESSVEAVAMYGYDEAVAKTDEQFIKDIQKGIRSDFYTLLGTGTGTATGTSFQAAIASAWAALLVAFEDTDATPVYFVNPSDIADYLGKATISTQTAFGFSYLQDFLGMGMVVIDSLVPAKTVYATAQENLNLYYADAATFDGFGFATDATGLIGVNHTPEMSNVTARTTAVYGVSLWAEYVDRIVKATIAAGV